MSRQRIKCDRCRTVTRAGKAEDWNSTVVKGRIVGFLCPGCQTPEENAEAEINQATTRYGMDSFGRMIGFPKIESN